MDGEQPDQVGARADQVIARMRAADGDAVAFAHGHILRVVTARWLEMPVSAGARFVLAAGAMSTLGFEHETQALQGWNLVPG